MQQMVPKFTEFDYHSLGSHHGPPIPDASVVVLLHEPQRPDLHNVQIGSTTCEFDAVVEVGDHLDLYTQPEFVKLDVHDEERTAVRFFVQGIPAPTAPQG